MCCDAEAGVCGDLLRGESGIARNGAHPLERFDHCLSDLHRDFLGGSVGMGRHLVADAVIRVLSNGCVDPRILSFIAPIRVGRILGRRKGVALTLISPREQGGGKL